MKILTAKEVAEMLQVSMPTLYKMAQEKEVPAFKVAGSWRFEKDSIEQWIRAQLESNAQEEFAQIKLTPKKSIEQDNEQKPIRAGGIRTKSIVKIIGKNS